jgi:hypothetical protein
MAYGENIILKLSKKLFYNTEGNEAANCKIHFFKDEIDKAMDRKSYFYENRARWFQVAIAATI